MTEDERKRIAAERKAAYRKRKKAEALEELSNKLPTPQELALKAAISPKQPLFKSTPNPDLESAWKRVQDGKIEPLSEKQAAEYVSNREKAEAVMAESVARLEAVNILFAKYSRSTNLPELLQGIIRELIILRVTLTDLIGGRK